MRRPVSGLVLCGGAGLRFGGRDKPLELLQGRALVDWVLKRLAPQVDGIWISANRHIAEYEARGWPVVLDDPAWQGAGPLAGLQAGLRACRPGWVLVCPGDMPLLPQGLAARLLNAVPPVRPSLDGATVQAALVHDGRRVQPLLALVHTDVAPDLQHYLESDGRAVRRFWSGLTTITVDGSDWQAQLENLNSQADLARLAAQLAASPDQRL